MTDLLEKAVAAIRQMPPADQDNIAHMMLSVAHLGDDDVQDIEPEHREAVLRGMAQADRGEFVEGEASEIVARAFARGRARVQEAK